jgi:alpha 1,6-mannosyltransferase
MTKPGLTYMAMMIDDVLDGLKESMKENKVSLRDSMLDMVNITGPRRLSDGVLKSLEKTLREKISVEKFSNCTRSWFVICS